MLSIPILLLASLLGQESSDPKQQSEDQKAIQDSSLISTSATVEAIDHKTRRVTLRGPEGRSSTFKVDKSVQNLDQVHGGDRVTVDYYESLAIEIVKVGTAQSGQESMVESAEPGEKPAVASAKETTIVATVEAIDRRAPSITLKDSKGKLTKVKVRHPERLKLVRVGDTLKITYTEAVAVAVEPPTKETR